MKHTIETIKATKGFYQKGLAIIDFVVVQLLTQGERSLFDAT